MQIEITESVARKVIETVDAGLCKGLGTPKPGEMCVEAAVNFALGLPHGDEPSCVGSAVRKFKIRLNDSNWSSNKARAEGMRKIAVAQLGSNKIDQREFANLVAIGTIQKIVPIALRAAAKLIPAHATALEAAAVGCEIIKTLAEGRKAAEHARITARGISAYAAAAYDAAAAAYAAYDAAAAAYAAYAAAYARDSILRISADICLDALIALKSEGCQFLALL